MGKDKAGGFLTPKAIANRIKAKGLQKLKWYCQMCQKQCRDENGFKCHMMSESHQRQLLLFAENPDKYIDTFSKDFLDGYLEVLSRRFGTKRVHANIVYQEYITDRNHVHMNSTQWETLTEFVKWLGKEGYCVVDETEKGWFVQYIDRNPEMIKKMEAAKVKEKMDLDDEEKTAKFIQKQIERAAENTKLKLEPEYTELLREKEKEKVMFNLNTAPMKKKEAAAARITPSADNPLDKLHSGSNKDGRANKRKTDPGKSSGGGAKRKSALDEIMEFEEEKREKMNRRENWLHPEIVVKVIAKKLGDKYYRKKGVIQEVQNLYTGIVKMLDSGDILKVDQSHLETVIPALGKSVLVVNGAYRGSESTLESLDEKRFCCSVMISKGPLKGRIVDNIQYEDVSKLYRAM